jgi:DNA-binding NtrC family response regulator
MARPVRAPGRPMGRLLLVEPDHLARATIQAAAAPFVDVESYPDFQAARARLSGTRFEFLVTNLRLRAYNGLHLVYLASSRQLGARAIVYSEQRDPSLAREIHRSGAFYEIASCLPVTLAGYLAALLPERDRRNPDLVDRRQPFRGGRRCWDRHLIRQK